MSADTTIDKPKKEFTIEQIYIKDFSYEAPHTPRVFKDAWSPQVKIDLNIAHELLEKEIYEVVLRITVTATQTKKSDQETDKNAEGKVLFLVEIKQAGIFAFKNFAQADLEELFAVFCPTILFPYAREAVSSAIAKGGFPAVFLAPVNFDHLYAQHQEKQQLLEAKIAGSA